MTTLSTSTSTATTTARAERITGLRWWREVLYVLVFYGVYSAVRNTQGSAAVSAEHAFNNATQIIRAEEWLAIFVEEPIQEAFLDARWFIQFWNVFYGTAHFAVTAFALIWCFRRLPERYARWRNTLAWMTGLALIGFALYPLMPPRLLPASYGFVDTLKDIGGLWSFDSGAMAKVSNQYAAMPSLHIGWSTWSACVLWQLFPRRTVRVLAVTYPFLTTFCIVVTGNHYLLDAAGGLVVFGAGWFVSGVVERVVNSSRASAD